MDAAERIIEAIATVEGLPFLLLVAALAFGETAFLADLVVPGEVGMVIAGAAAAEQGTSLAVVVAAGVVGATVGDLASFTVGRRWGAAVVSRWRWSRRRLAPRLERAQAYFERRGGVAVLAGRWVGAFRAVVPVVAGMAGMPYRRFLPWNVAASITWVGTVVTLGYLFGDELAAAVDRVGLGVSLVVVAALVVRAVVKWRRHQAEGEPAEAAEPAVPGDAGGTGAGGGTLAP